MRFAVCAIPLLGLLAACSQSDAPSDELEAAAEELVENVVETPDPNAGLGPFEPRDECSEIEGYDSFLAALNAAIDLRDTDLMVALAATDIKLGFGGEDGEENLRLALDNSEGGLWSDLAEVTTLGCAANSQGGVTMPWYFAQNTGGDPFETMIVTGKAVALRSAPGMEEPVVATIDWDVVELVLDEDSGISTFGGEGEDSWTRVRYANGPEGTPVEGYIRSPNLRSVIDYRLIASSRNGRWRITAFLAGD